MTDADAGSHKPVEGKTRRGGERRFVFGFRFQGFKFYDLWVNG